MELACTIIFLFQESIFSDSKLSELVKSQSQRCLLVRFLNTQERCLARNTGTTWNDFLFFSMFYYLYSCCFIGRKIWKQCVVEINKQTSSIQISTCTHSFQVSNKALSSGIVLPPSYSFMIWILFTRLCHLSAYLCLFGFFNFLCSWLVCIFPLNNYDILVQMISLC